MRIRESGVPSMADQWETCPPNVKNFVLQLLKHVEEILSDRMLGFYVHGSLAMGGFNPRKSDIDILVVTSEPLSISDKRKCAQLLLQFSKSPFPIEISFLNQGQLKSWQHPCPYDFHYSEWWRNRFENKEEHASLFLNEIVKTDPDLAAHIVITRTRGICVKGKPIPEVFPEIPRADYIASILGDYKDCLKNIEAHPVYSVLNSLRVLWFLKEDVIASKIEAGQWGLSVLPNKFTKTIRKAADSYLDEHSDTYFDTDELILFKDYISKAVQNLLK